jgi:chitinase
MWSVNIVILLIALGFAPLATADTYCSADVPCASGCCGGQSNVCGLGPDYCGPENCINNCDAKSECNPGDWPAQYVNATTCPLNVCCSEYGFCGTTEEFCGDATVTRPSCDVDSASLSRVIGYYNSAGASRGCGGMIPLSFPQGVYTHVYFAFGSINPDTFEVIPAVSGDELLYPQLAALQVRDLGQQLWISIGGWDFSDSDAPTATTFSDLAGADQTQQNAFFASLILFMTTWGFTGVDIDWEYPAADDRNGRAEDYTNFPIFLANLKGALDEYNFGLSITLPTSYWYLQHFDIVSIEPSVDWFNFMSYDLHGTWDIGDEWTGAYLDAQTNLTEIEPALDLLWRNNITASKVNMGLAFYGRTFTLSDSSCSEPGCPYLSAGDAGDCSDTAGILFNSEIEEIISENGLTPTLYTDAAVKVISWNGDQWVSYDDEDTWKLKADFAKSECLGGVFVWSVDEDDSMHTFSNGLAASIGNEINLDSVTGLTTNFVDFSTSTSGGVSLTEQYSYCRFINCGEVCPSGFTTIVRGDKTSQLMLDSTECPPGSDQTQTLCCPTDTEVPTCQWRGFQNNGKCKGGCNSDEAEVGTISAGCSSGYQSACCTITASTKPWSTCQWTSSCESDDTCPSGYSNFVVGSREGWGGRPSCKSGYNYNYCCSGSVPDAFTECEWVGHETPFRNEQYCSDSCPSGSIRIAEQGINLFFGSNKGANSADCYYGNEAYCCSGPPATPVVARGIPPVYQDETAEEFDALLRKFLANPICPDDWDAQYSASVSLAARDILDTRATDQSITLELLLPIMSSWISSQYPREDLTNIYNNALEEYGYGSDAANASMLTEAVYGETGSWTGEPLYAPMTLMSQTLCDIADSASGLENLAEASQELCTYPSDDDDISSLKARTLTEVTTNDRSGDGVQPSIYFAINGILNVSFSLSIVSLIPVTDLGLLLLGSAQPPLPAVASIKERKASYPGASLLDRPNPRRSSSHLTPTVWRQQPYRGN